MSITRYTHFRMRLKKFLWHYIHMAFSSNAWILKGVFARKCTFNIDRIKTWFYKPTSCLLILSCLVVYKIQWGSLVYMCCNNWINKREINCHYSRFMFEIRIGCYPFRRLPETAFALTWQFFLAIPTTLLIVLGALDFMWRKIRFALKEVVALRAFL